MKYFFLISIFFLISAIGRKSNVNDLSFNYGVLVNNHSNIPLEYRFMLRTKILQQLTQTRISIDSPSYAFIISPSLSIVNEEVTPTAPSLYTINFQLILTLSDYSQKVKFNSMTLNAKGSGRSKEKAIISALNNIRINHTDFSEFLEIGDKRIVNYLDENKEQLLIRASQYNDTNLCSQDLDLLISQLGMLLQAGIEVQKATEYIKKINTQKCVNECRREYQKMRILLNKFDFDAALVLIKQHGGVCDFNEELIDLEAYFDKGIASSASNHALLDSIKVVMEEQENKPCNGERDSVKLSVCTANISLENTALAN